MWRKLEDAVLFTCTAILVLIALYVLAGIVYAVTR
jgi:hypothetical protein